MKNPSFHFVFGCLFSILTFLYPVCRAQEKTTAAPLEIVATTGMVGDVVRQIAGDKARVTVLMGEGIDPHLYKPTRDDVARLAKADMIFYNGLMLEGKMTDVFNRLSRSGKPVIAVTGQMAPEILLKDGENPSHPDPHVWMDAAAWAKIIPVIQDALTQKDPENADIYKSNAASYRAELVQLDAYIRQSILSIPEKQRVLLTAHDAFGYFGRAYEIDVRGVQGISTESEAGVQDINNLVDFIVKNKIGAVFVESTIADKNLKALIEGARSRGQKVEIGGTLYSDAMGAAGTYEGTYTGMLDHNATTITRALGGEAPEKGMRGRLSENPKSKQ